MYCGNCGTQVSDSAAFCPNCGKPISQPSEKTAVESTPIQPAVPLMSPPPSKPKAGKKIRSIVVALTVIVAVVFVIYSMQKHPVSDLKGIVFGDRSISFGEAVNNSLRNVSWESEKLDKTRYRVTVKGFCPDEYSHIGITVDLNYADGDVYASVDSVTVDDESYDNLFMILYVMGIVYGE